MDNSIGRYTSVVILCFFVFIQCVNGCGFTTHNVIAHRAQSYYFKERFDGYEEIINTHLNSALGGAPFPDYLYTCGKTHDNGEWAHWTGFQYNASNYIRSLPTPWTDDTKKLVAFMFGVTSHYIADINWHGLSSVPHAYGFIQTLGLMDYNCTGNLCEVAHTAADVGGEFTATYQSDLTWFEPAQWYVPTAHLVKIYALDGRTVEPLSIDECHLEFAAGGEAIKDLGFFIYRQETSKSPFLQENYIHRPLGGVDDMAVWTARMWNRFAEWVEHGAPYPPPPLAPRSSQSSYSKSSMEMISTLGRLYMQSPLYHKWLHAEPHSVERRLARVTLRDTVFNNVMSVREPTELQRNARMLLQSKGFVGNTQASTKRTVRKVSPNAKGGQVWDYQSTTGLEYVGYDLAVGDFNGDGVDDVVMSAPGHGAKGDMQVGRVYIVYGGTNNTAVPLDGSEIFGRFGTSVVVVDFNLDGVDDLVVSSPLAGWNWTEIQVQPLYHYRGRVDVFFGSKGNGVSHSSPNFTISSTDDLTFLGTVLRTGDIDQDGHKDLLIGCPYSPSRSGGMQRGMVVGFVSGKNRKSGSQVSYKSGELTLHGGDDFSWFGHDVAMVVDESHGPMLLVGAPGYRSHDKTTTVGRLYAYLYQSFDKSFFTITGVQQQSKLGYSFVYGTPIKNKGSMLALSVPTADTSVNFLEGAALAGEVVVFSLSSLSGGNDYKVDKISSHTVLKSGTYGARFGWTILFEDVNNDGDDDLIVGAPMYTAPWDADGHQSGAVLAWKGGSGFPSGSVEPAESHCDWIVGGRSTHGRFGMSVAVTSSGDIIVGEPQNTPSSSVEMAGSVYRYTNPL